jgi:hypothetical protein
MKELFILIAHLLTTLVKLARPGGVRAITKAATSNRLSGPLFDTLHLSTSDYERARKAAPGWDIYSLESEWREYAAGRDAWTTPVRPSSPSAEKSISEKRCPERNGSIKSAGVLRASEKSKNDYIYEEW